MHSIFLLPWAIIIEKAALFGLDPLLVAAIIMTESAGNNYAIRAEPKWRYAYNIDEFAKECGITRESEKLAQSTGWGLMQVMGTVAREYGIKGVLTQLCMPEINIEYGCRHLKNKLDLYKNTIDAIAAYNAGGPRKRSGKYVNQTYVDKVTATTKQLHLLEKDVWKRLVRGN